MAIITRRKLLSAAVACVGVSGYAFAVEPDWLETTYTSIPLAPGGHRIRILQLSDLHLSPAVPIKRIERAIELGMATKPDIVCLTGDFVTNREPYDAPSYSSVLRQISAMKPTFAVLGNHDGGWREFDPGEQSRVADVLRAAQIDLLHNKSRRLEVRGGTFHLVGVGDLWAWQIDAAEAFKKLPSQGSVILLSHNPDSKSSVKNYRWDLMLSGHTHGGQVVVPFAGPPYVPVTDRRYIAGLGEWEGRTLFISRGVGSLHNLRFFCRPEVSVLDVDIA